MTNLGRALLVAVAASVAPFLWSGTARAQSAFFEGGVTNVVGSALALPVDVGENGAYGEDDRVTQIVITNAGRAVFLHVLLIDDDWSTENFSCFVTRNETTLFEFRREGYQTRLSYECTTSFAFTPPPVPSFSHDDPVDIDRGIMFVTTEEVVFAADDPNDPLGYETVTANQLLGDATVIDFDQGVAYSFDAISFRSTENDGNREYQFNGEEYTEFPARLATNFIAPIQGPYWGSDTLDAELVLFSLDGTIGSGPQVKVSVNFYNDDELRFSNVHSFDCFDVLDLGEFDARFYADNLGSDTGHLVLTPELVGQEDETHDSQFDGGAGANEQRRAPVHGWLVQTATLGQQIGGGYHYLGGDAAWGRPLASSLTSLVPATGDVPTLNALCPVAPCE